MSANKRILIIGNGPSTRHLVDWGFENIPSDVDTFGMGAAYRFFREINWWPTFYALGDEKVVFSHREELANVVRDPDVTTERFYLSWPVTEHDRLEIIDHTSTGDFAFKKSIEAGYEDVYLIGIEGSYVEHVPGSRELSDYEFLELGFDQLDLTESSRESLRVISDQSGNNPNYFFPNYQQNGDVYSLPQGDRHRQRWEQMQETAEVSQVRILNLSRSSRINFFPRSELSAALGNGSQQTSNDVPATYWYGPFNRESKQRVRESDAVLEVFEARRHRPVMIDVGACRGHTFLPYAAQGWIVHAFEPNPVLFDRLLRDHGSRPNVTISRSAVSDRAAEAAPFYTSEESLGISTLEPFRRSHKLAARVPVTTLNDYLRDSDIDNIDFLKIDAEGLDLMILKGLDLGRHQVDMIVCEFEDLKTEPLGYSMNDMAKHLQSFGYAVYVSEWHPIVQYGGPHDWRMLKSYPCELEAPDAWGNMFAFRSDPGIWALTQAITGDLPHSAPRVDPADYKAAQTQIKVLEKKISSIHASTSWRMTSPVRVTGDATKGLIRRLRNGPSR